MKFINRVKHIIKCKKGDEVTMSHSIWTVIVFVIGGALLSLLYAAFTTDIGPSLVASIKNMVTW